MYIITVKLFLSYWTRDLLVFAVDCLRILIWVLSCLLITLHQHSNYSFVRTKSQSYMFGNENLIQLCNFEKEIMCMIVLIFAGKLWFDLANVYL